MWKVKEATTSHIAHMSLRASSQEDWCFDSGYSRHVTGEKNYLKDLKPYSNSSVTFGDGVKGKIIGKWKIDHSCLPILDDVLLIECATTNLISINQLCDQDICDNHSEFVALNIHL